MPWRRFATLLAGLPPDSRWATLAKSTPQVVTDLDEAERIFVAIGA